MDEPPERRLVPDLQSPPFEDVSTPMRIKPANAEEGYPDSSSALSRRLGTAAPSSNSSLPVFYCDGAVLEINSVLKLCDICETRSVKFRVGAHLKFQYIGDVTLTGDVSFG